MTETEARAALAAFVAVSELEVWIAEQPWQEAPGGWTVLGEQHKWRFRLEPAPGRARVILSGIEGEPATQLRVPLRLALAGQRGARQFSSR